MGQGSIQTDFVLKSLKKIFKFLCSLKLAVLVIFSLAVALSVATVVESTYDTKTAQYWIYRAFWFRGILALLGINIFSVAISRYPWKKKHIPFLLAHLGILILLGGSWITDRFGIDGNLRLNEGEIGREVELDQASLLVIEKKRVQTVPVPWIPPQVEFKPIDLLPYGLDLQIDQYLSHADSNISFVPSKSKSSEKGASALNLKLVGGPMGLGQDLWLWQGASAWKAFHAGPAWFSIGSLELAAPPQPGLAFEWDGQNKVKYIAQNSQGQKVQGQIPVSKMKGFQIKPGWKAGLSVTIADWIPNAESLTSYKPARIQNGPQAPPPALHLSDAGKKTDIWLGLGDRAVLNLGYREIELIYYPNRVHLPFALRLDRFSIEHDPGTYSAASYSSRVTAYHAEGQKDATISMNDPLEIKGFTVYQASYEEGEPRPITSIFSVNQDPGRFWKYLGSFLIVLGSILLFLSKYKKAKPTVKERQVEVTV